MLPSIHRENEVHQCSQSKRRQRAERPLPELGEFLVEPFAQGFLDRGFHGFVCFAQPATCASMLQIMVNSMSNFAPMRVRNSFIAALVSAIFQVLTVVAPP